MSGVRLWPLALAQTASSGLSLQWAMRYVFHSTENWLSTRNHVTYSTVPCDLPQPTPKQPSSTEAQLNAPCSTIPKELCCFGRQQQLLLICLQIFFARWSSDPKRKGGHRAGTGGGKSVNTNGGERRRVKDKQMPEEMCLSESHTGERGVRMWLGRQTTSFRKHDDTDTAKHERAVKINSDCQRWQQEI